MFSNDFAYARIVQWAKETPDVRIGISAYHQYLHTVAQLLAKDLKGVYQRTATRITFNTDSTIFLFSTSSLQTRIRGFRFHYFWGIDLPDKQSVDLIKLATVLGENPIILLTE